MRRIPLGVAWTVITALAALPVASSQQPAQSTARAGVVGVDGVAGFDRLSSAERRALSRRRIFFGHQSVGQNLVDAAAGLGFQFRTVSGHRDYALAPWGEAGVGENGDPAGKIDAFEEYVVQRDIGRSVDAAGFKLCWVDFTDQTDVAALSARYDAAIARIAARYPRLRLLHVTTPLTTNEPALDALRWRYGRGLIARYAARNVVLDLAAIESTDARGRPCTAGGARRLCDAWASDEGHLNERGATRAAKALVYAWWRALR